MFFRFYTFVLLVTVCQSAFQNQRFRANSRQSSSGSASARQRAANRNCSPPRLTNGIVTPLFKGKMMRFDCYKGYSRLGDRYSECLSGRWSIYIFPICIKAGCPNIITPDNGKITYLNAKASAMLFCEPNFEIVGNSYSHCNGTHWDREVGKCKETDNTPSLSCDFESESICGWVHDTDHDFDFERRSGYNNKTITLYTGPHADHTTQVPFQGHYMVINTNTEVYKKRARLISPLYNISAETICFKLYYHMYGVSVGTLRVYMKPESISMQEILLEDTETEVKNEYLVFEEKGSKANAWIEGGGFLKPANESFQIIIEAVSGQTRLSDIAFDDISILTDDDCSREDSNAQEIIEEDDGVIAVGSCFLHCFDDDEIKGELTSNKSFSCSCARDCASKRNCCPDFIEICMKDGDDLSSTKSSLDNATTKSTTQIFSTKITSTNFLVASTTTQMKTTKRLVTSTTQGPTTKQVEFNHASKPTFQMLNTTKASITTTNLPIINEKIVNATTIKTQSDVLEIIGNPSEDAIDDEDDVPADDATVLSDAITNEKYVLADKSHGMSASFAIKVALVAITTISVVVVALLLAVRLYKKSTNPLNYKENGECCTQKANEEFSEIRYLTSDETLDFNLASPETASFENLTENIQLN